MIAQRHSESSVYRYSMQQWQEIACFVEGEEWDAKHQFRLADDTWNAWPYYHGASPTDTYRYRLRFGHFTSFLKPFVKWYCYQRLLQNEAAHARFYARFPYCLRRADRYLTNQQISTLDDIAPAAAFAPVWEAYLDDDSGSNRVISSGVFNQQQTFNFWMALTIAFGAPLEVPPPFVPRERPSPVESGLDVTKIIPPVVINQLVNKLALHRNGEQRVSRYDHLRLCILVLNICVGRRISELLLAPRGTGPLGPLSWHAARNGPKGGELWFRFAPLKRGKRDQVYISPEWHDVVLYCVARLLQYSDEVRHLTLPADQGRFILVSSMNRTAGWGVLDLIYDTDDMPPPSVTTRKHRAIAGVLTYAGLRYWLHRRGGKGIMEYWNITEDGSATGPIYHLRTHQARHTRQSALILDGQISRLAAQRDLNHRDTQMQVAYQHTVREDNARLLEKAKAGYLIGQGATWLQALLNEPPAEGSGFTPGIPVLLSPRWRHLMATNPHFLQLNRVPSGFCALAQGPVECAEFLNCTEATEVGCSWFAMDPDDPEQIQELRQRVEGHHANQRASETAGRVVEARKYQIQAERTQRLYDEVLRRASRANREELAALLHEEEDKHEATDDIE